MIQNLAALRICRNICRARARALISHRDVLPTNSCKRAHKFRLRVKKLLSWTSYTPFHWESDARKKKWNENDENKFECSVVCFHSHVHFFFLRLFRIIHIINDEVFVKRHWTVVNSIIICAWHYDFATTRLFQLTIKSWSRSSKFCKTVIFFMSRQYLRIRITSPGPGAEFFQKSRKNIFNTAFKRK